MSTSTSVWQVSLLRPSSLAPTLPLLEFTLAELWAHQQNRKLVRPVTAVSPGGTMIELMTDALERHAEAIYADLSRVFGAAMVRKVIMDMIWLADPKRGGEDTRRVRQRREFAEREWALVEQLSGQGRPARLVTIGASEVDGEATAEIVHEALIRGWDRLLSWLAEDRAFRVWLQKTEEIALEWRQEKDNDYLLISGKRLDDAQLWWSTRPTSDIATVFEFVGRSITVNADKKFGDIESMRNHLSYEVNSLKVGNLLKVGVMVWLIPTIIVWTIMWAASTTNVHYLDYVFGPIGNFVDVIGNIYIYVRYNPSVLTVSIVLLLGYSVGIHRIIKAVTPK